MLDPIARLVIAARNREDWVGGGPATAIVVVPGATHLFEEPGTLERATLAAWAWFIDNLDRPSRVRA